MSDEDKQLDKNRVGDLDQGIVHAVAPSINDICPECSTGIQDGDAWQLDPDFPLPRRVHRNCVTRRAAYSQNLVPNEHAPRHAAPEPSTTRRANAEVLTIDPAAREHIGYVLANARDLAHMGQPVQAVIALAQIIEMLVPPSSTTTTDD
ncbi:hypothetical protein [Mycolicibacter kumamotonensis]|uniref:Uncharacterized protein n=1 Tax=Mycolicibacter kumamotonensis TaxID=354243 RepID=A0A1B8SLA6_9MYCO|nr:hypothetical protein [Mycolicibacter kumamotonensis]OBY33473.1 hypothetical protein ACT18_00550 [Mycolicibacter kumamotonensis]